MYCHILAAYRTVSVPECNPSLNPFSLRAMNNQEASSWSYLGTEAVPHYAKYYRVLATIACR